MAAIARMLAQKFSYDEKFVENLKTLVMFCAVGLFVAILFAVYGLD